VICETLLLDGLIPNLKPNLIRCYGISLEGLSRPNGSLVTHFAVLEPSGPKLTRLTGVGACSVACAGLLRRIE
jgi:hypothetical protein